MSLSQVVRVRGPDTGVTLAHLALPKSSAERVETSFGGMSFRVAALTSTAAAAGSMEPVRRMLGVTFPQQHAARRRSGVTTCGRQRLHQRREVCWVLLVGEDDEGQGAAVAGAVVGEGARHISAHHLGGCVPQRAEVRKRGGEAEGGGRGRYGKRRTGSAG